MSKQRSRSRAKKKRARERRREMRLERLMHDYYNMPKDFKKNLDKKHVPVDRYGNLDAYLKSDPRVLTVGYNPTSSEKERYPLFTGGLAEYLFYYMDMDLEVPRDLLQELQYACDHYFCDNEYRVRYGKRKIGPHSYFRGNGKVLQGLGVSYDPEAEDTSGTVIHVDLNKFSTLERYGLLPVLVREQMITYSKITTDIQELIPHVVIFGVELNTLISIFPGVAWQCLVRKQKNKVVCQVNYAWHHVQNVGKVLFVQTTPSPNPFTRLDDFDKVHVGKLIKRLLQNKNQK